MYLAMFRFIVVKQCDIKTMNKKNNMTMTILKMNRIVHLNVLMLWLMFTERSRQYHY